MKKANVRKPADRDAATLVIESLMVLFYISLLIQNLLLGSNISPREHLVVNSCSYFRNVYIKVF